MRVARHKVAVTAVTFLFAFCSTLQISFAQEAPPPESVPAAAAAPAPIDLDLASTAASITFAANNAAATPVNINMAGVMQTVNPGQMVTPAQAVAAYQVMRTGAQDIVLGALGQATGGSMNISPWLAANLGSLVIPSGVSVINNFANNPALSLAGSLTNAGTFYAVSTNPAVSTASIAALNIANQQAALLTSVLPQSGLAGYANAISNLSLSLSAINNIVNAGMISSAGTLSMTAGGSITNASNMAGISAVMQAMNNVNLNAASIVNSGLISSITGNINIASQLSGSAASQALQALNVNNVGGIMQALNGNINVGNVFSSGNTNISLYGGNWLSKALNVNAGLGSVTASLGQLTGALCVQAGAAHVYADTSVLRLGNTKIEGDPTFVSTGDIELNGELTAAQSLSLIAQGNIYIPTDAEVSISTTGVNSDITLIAGATVSCPSCPAGSPIPDNGGAPIGPLDTATVTFTSGNGGYIDLYTNNSFSGSNLIDASASNGNVTLAAYSNGTDTGWIALQPTSAIGTAGDGTGNQGNVTIIAGGSLSSINRAIAVGSISTSASGAINVSTAQPVATSLVYSSDGTHTGTLTAGSTLSGNPDVVLGALTTSGADATVAGGNGGTSGAITVEANGNIQIFGNISGNGGNGVAGAGLTGQAGGAGGDASTINLTSNTGSISVLGIQANGGTGTFGGQGTQGVLTPGGAGGDGGNGGNGGVLIFTANTSISARTIEVNGGTAGDGGVGGDSNSDVAGIGGTGGLGGMGGTIDFVAGTSIDVTQSSATLTANGGTGGLAGFGGNGGATAGTGGTGGAGGLGGCVCLSAGTSLAVGAITVIGGQGGLGGDGFGSGAPAPGGSGGVGGDGGSVTLTATTTFDTSLITSIGGDAGNSGNGVRGGTGGAVGGNGGFIDLQNSGDIGSSGTPIGAIISTGGMGGIASAATAFIGGQTGGQGGVGGNIQIVSSGNIFAGDITTTGGLGQTGGGGSLTGGAGGAGGLGGDITMTSSVSGSIKAGIIASYGGNGGIGGGATSVAGAGGAGGDGGTVTLTTTIGQVTDTTVNSLGGTAGAAANATGTAGTGGAGGNAGAIEIVAPSGIVQVIVNANGGIATDGGVATITAGTGGKGGNAGAIALTASSGPISNITINANAADGGNGGNRTSPGIGGTGGVGGNGSNVILNADQQISNATITARAGVGGGTNSTIGSAGGDGTQSNVTLTTNGAVVNTALLGSTSDGGGFGTNMSVIAATSIDIVNIQTSAGHQSGNVSLLAGTSVNLGSVFTYGLNGRNGSAGTAGNSGGHAGNVSVIAGTSINPTGTFVINVLGGQGGTGGNGTFTAGFQIGGNGGQGGRAGNVVLSAGGDIGNNTSSGGYIIGNGGIGGTGGDAFSSAANGSGGAGGNGAMITLTSGGSIGRSLGGMTATGGLGGSPFGSASASSPGGNGGAGGNGGTISIRAGGDIGNSTALFGAVVDVSGGAGANGAPSLTTNGNSGAGGNGGFISIYSGGSIGTSIGNLSSNGASGGDGATGGNGSTGGTGGNGGNGGIIQLFALGGIGTVAAPLQNAQAFAGPGGAGGFDCCPPSTQQASGVNGIGGYLLFAAGGSDGINFGSSGTPAALTGGSITFITGFGSTNPAITKVMPTNGAYTVGAFDLVGTGITINGSVLAANPMTAVQNIAGTQLAITAITGDTVAFSVTSGVAVGTGTIVSDPSVTNLSGVGTGAPTGQDLIVFSVADIIDTGVAGTINQAALTPDSVGGQIILVAGTNSAALSAGDYGTGTGISPFLTLTPTAGSANNINLGATDLNTNSNLIFVNANSQNPGATTVLSTQNIANNGSQPSGESFNGLPGGTIVLTAALMTVGSISAVGGAGAPGTGINYFGGHGAPGGLISLTATQSFTVLDPVTAYGGAGRGGVRSESAEDVINGGAGGNGGIILMTSFGTSFGSLIDDIVDASGSGGGGGAAYSVFSNNGGAGGIGGSGGLITITVASPSGISISGTVGTAAGGSGGAGGASNGTGSGGGGGGGGSLADGGFGGEGGNGSSSGGDGEDGNQGGPGFGGLGGAAGAPGSTNGINGQNAGVSIVPGGQIYLSAPAILVLGTAGGLFASDSVVAAGANGQVTVNTWATLGDIHFAGSANFGLGAPPSAVGLINPGTLTTAGDIAAGGSNNIQPISINGTLYTSPYAAGTTTTAATIDITESGVTYTISTGSLVTPAELVAAIQVSSSATREQPLILDGTGLGTGFASGGSFDVALDNVPIVWGGLVLPAGVTANFNYANVSFLFNAFIDGTMNFTQANSQLTIISGSAFLNGSLNFNDVSTSTLQAENFSLLDGSSIFTNGALNIIGATGQNLTVFVSGTASIAASLSTGTNINFSVDPGNALFFTAVGPSTLALQTGSIATPVQISADTIVISPNFSMEGGTLTGIGFVTNSFTNNGSVTVDSSPFCCFIGVYPSVTGQNLLVLGTGTTTGNSTYFGVNPFAPGPSNQASVTTIDGTHVVNGFAALYAFDAGGAVALTGGASLTASDGIDIDAPRLSNAGTITETSGAGIYISDNVSASGVIDESTGVFNTGLGSTTYETFSGPISFTSTPTFNGFLNIFDPANWSINFNPGSVVTATAGDGTIAVVSDPGFSLSIDGIGTFRSNRIVLTAASGNLAINGAGTLTFEGTSILTATTGSVAAPFKTLAHGGFGVTINSPDTANPADFSFNPQTGITRNATGTAPSITGAAITIVTDPLIINGTIVGIAAPVPPTPTPGGGGSTQNTSNNNSFVFPAVTDNSQNNINVQIGTRLPTDNTMILPPGETTEVANPINQLNGQVNRFNESAIEATIVNTSQFTPEVLTSLSQSGLTHGPNTGNSYYNLDRGSAIFTPENGSIVVGTHECDVHIEKGSAVHVYETGHDVSILNLDDQHKGAVKVVAGGKLIVVQPGKALVLTRVMEADYDRVNPLPSIATRHTKKVELGNGITAFVSDFSILSALMRVVPLKQLVNSNDPKERQLAHALLKNALLITNFSAMTAGPYKATQ